MSHNLVIAEAGETVLAMVPRMIRDKMPQASAERTDVGFPVHHNLA